MLGGKGLCSVIEDGLFVYKGMDPTHETRGWTPKPNLSVVVDGNNYTTNELGQRSLNSYSYNSQQYQILVIGNSLTFGIDADDSFIWPNMLQASDTRFNIVDLSVGGYGIDQMSLTLEETIDSY
jgi:hypothetical protein